jgi:hypothetical protein
VHIYYFETFPTAATEAKCYNTTKQTIQATTRLVRTSKQTSTPSIHITNLAASPSPNNQTDKQPSYNITTPQ